MAFGIDDVLTMASAGISLTDTIVQVIKRYRESGQNIDLERLIEEVRITALERIDDADTALNQFERMLVEKGVDLGMPLADVITSTPFWQPFEQHRLNQIRKSFHDFSDSIYSATDDVAALVRCMDQTQKMGTSVVESAAMKHQLHSDMLKAKSLGEAIKRLRAELINQKDLLTSS